MKCIFFYNLFFLMILSHVGYTEAYVEMPNSHNLSGRGIYPFHLKFMSTC